jgi:hypothetical protein
MKKKFLVFMFSFIVSSAFSQAYVCVIVNYQNNDCKNTSDCSYGYAFSKSTKSYDLKKDAMANAPADCPKIDYPDVTYSDKMVNVMVIVRLEMKDSGGCTRRTFAAGFGNTFEDAKADAIKRLGTRNWSFDSTKHPVQVVENRTF